MYMQNIFNAIKMNKKALLNARMSSRVLSKILLFL